MGATTCENGITHAAAPPFQWEKQAGYISSPSRRTDGRRDGQEEEETERESERHLPHPSERASERGSVRRPSDTRGDCVVRPLCACFDFNPRHSSHRVVEGQCAKVANFATRLAFQ